MMCHGNRLSWSRLLSRPRHQQAKFLYRQRQAGGNLRQLLQKFYRQTARKRTTQRFRTTANAKEPEGHGRAFEVGEVAAYCNVTQLFVLGINRSNSSTACICRKVAHMWCVHAVARAGLKCVVHICANMIVFSPHIYAGRFSHIWAHICWYTGRIYVVI